MTSVHARSILAAAFLVIVAAISCQAAEFRGLWVDAFHPGFKSAAETTEMVVRARDAGFSALFVQVRKRGDAYYVPGIEPRASDIDASYDPLADVIRKAQGSGMEVHAWISVLDVFADLPGYTATSDHVLAKHPEWLMKSKDDKTVFQSGRIALDPGIPEVRSYIVSVIMDVVSRYDIDGVHLDNIRYFGDRAGYNSASVGLFNSQCAKSGTPTEDDSAWCTWRRDRMTSLIREIHEAVAAAKPDVRVSASVFGDRTVAREEFFQDWGAWMSQGILDFAVPMVFALDDDAYRKTVDDVVASAQGRPVYIGQGAWRLPADQTIGQLQYARSKGCTGLVVYSYDYARRPGANGAPSVLDALKARVFMTAEAVPAVIRTSASAR